MKLAELFRNTGIDCRTESEKNIEITGISYDSRHTRPGDLFVCIRGFQSDGHDFAEAAAKAGAAAVIAEKIPEKTGEVPVFLTEDSRKALSAVSANFFGHPSDDMLVFGDGEQTERRDDLLSAEIHRQRLGKRMRRAGHDRLRLRRTEL